MAVVSNTVKGIPCAVEALAGLWPVREHQNICKYLHHRIYILSYLNYIPQWVVNVLLAVNTKIYHFWTLLSRFEMAIVTSNPQLRVAKTLFDRGHLIGSLVREPLSTAHRIININYKVIIKALIEIYFKVIAKRNAISVRS